MKITLVSCVGKKHRAACMAKDLYSSQWFLKAKAVAEASDGWHILSAFHGLIHPTDIIEPYDLAMHQLKRARREAWAYQVFSRIISTYNPALVTIEIFAGRDYREFLVPLLVKAGFTVLIPMEGMGIGKQLAYLTSAMGHIAAEDARLEELADDDTEDDSCEHCGVQNSGAYAGKCACVNSDDKCSECGAPNNDGEGWDGMCGNCADRADVDDDDDGTPSDATLRQLARDEYANGDINIDDDALISHADTHAWVQAWVRVEIPVTEKQG